MNNIIKARRIFFIFTILIFFLSGCGSILKNDFEKLPIDTVPAGAKIKVAGQTCHSPCDLELKRGQDLDLIITKPGYKEVRMAVPGDSLDMLFYGNLVFFYLFPIGMGVDYYTGNAFDFEPEHLQVNLEKL